MAGTSYNRQYRQPTMAYDRRFQSRASEPNPELASMMQLLLANQIVQQREGDIGRDEGVIQSTEDQEVGNPYMGNIFRPSPAAGRLSPLGRFNDMGSRMAAERASQWANAKQAVADTYAQQDHAMYRDDRGLNVTRTGGPEMRDVTAFTSPYGSGNNMPVPRGGDTFGQVGSYQDWIAQNHHDRYAKPKSTAITDRNELKLINEAVRRLGLGKKH